MNDDALGTLITLAISLPIPVLIAIFLIVQIRRNKLSVAENEERRARSRFHRWRFAAFLAKVRAMNPPDAVVAFEHEHLPMRGWFSKALDWPTLEELLPHVTPGEVDALRGRVSELNSTAQRNARAVRYDHTMTDRAAMADLKLSFPEFSASALRRAYDDGSWYALW